jgi:proteasome lid subunit RPN8/RPN11
MLFWKKKNQFSPPRTNIREWKITHKCLTLILEASKANYPREFGGFLRVDPQHKDTITEVVLLPGTISGDAHAIFQLHMLPSSYHIIGTVHSHPSGAPYPSGADLQLFEKFGGIHLIVASPYIETSWRAYSNAGEEMIVTIV